MRLLTSKIPPLNQGSYTFRDAFFDMFTNADAVNLASGYISADSLTELQETLARNENRQVQINLIIGMHFFEGISRVQYDAATKLNSYLTEHERGNVSVVKDYEHKELIARDEQVNDIREATLNAFSDQYNIPYEHIDMILFELPTKTTS